MKRIRFPGFGCLLPVFLLILSACGYYPPALPKQAEQGAPSSPPPGPTTASRSSPSSPVTFEPDTNSLGVSCPAEGGYSSDQLYLSYDWQLIGGVHAEQFPAVENTPEHWVFTFINGSGPCTQTDMPWLRSASTPKIYLFPVEKYASADPTAAERIADLRQLIDRWPQVPQGNLPVLPILQGDPAFQAALRLVNFENGSGVRFITQYPLEERQVRGDEYFYTIQGLTNGGGYYLSAIFPLYMHPELLPHTPAAVTFIPPPTPLPTFLTPPPTRVYPAPEVDSPGQSSYPQQESLPGPAPTETPRPYPIGEMDPRITTIANTPEPTPPLSEQDDLWFASQFAPNLDELDRLVQSIQVRAAEPSPVAGEPSSLPQSCKIEGQLSAASSRDKFCFAYPPGFTADPNLPSPFTLNGPPRGQGQSQSFAMMSIEVEGLPQDDSLSLDERVNEFLSGYAPEVLTAAHRQSISLGGEPAEMVELPFTRMVFVIYSGRFYRLSFWVNQMTRAQEVTAVVAGTLQVVQVWPSETPSEEELPQAQADLDALYQSIMASFSFLP